RRETRAPWTTSEKRSRPVPGSTPNQCCALTPPSAPSGEVSGPSASGWYVKGSLPLRAESCGAKTAASRLALTRTAAAAGTGRRKARQIRGREGRSSTETAASTGRASLVVIIHAFGGPNVND